MFGIVHTSKISVYIDIRPDLTKVIDFYRAPPNNKSLADIYDFAKSEFAKPAWQRI